MPDQLRNLPSWLQAGAAFLTALALAGPACANAARLPVGSTVEHYVEIARMQVPLPAGRWILAGRDYSRPDDLAGVPYGAIESDVLFQVSDRRVASFVIVHRNYVPVEDGWSTSESCSQDGLTPPQSYLTSETHTFCSFVHELAVTGAAAAEASDAWKSALGYAWSNGITVPTKWLMVGYRRTDRRELLDVRYNFAKRIGPMAETVALTSESGADSRDRGDVPLREIRSLTDWRDLMRGPIEAGFNNRLPVDFDLPLPDAVSETVSQPEVAMKLQLLDRLHEQNIVSDIDYRLEHAAIVATSVKLADKNISNEELTLWKTVTDLTTSGLADFVIDAGILRSPVAAAGLFSVQRFFDVVQSAGQEWGWNTFGPRSLREAPPIDFPGAGVAAASQ